MIVILTLGNLFRNTCFTDNPIANYILTNLNEFCIVVVKPMRGMSYGISIFKGAEVMTIVNVCAVP